MVRHERGQVGAFGCPAEAAGQSGLKRPHSKAGFARGVSLPVPLTVKDVFDEEIARKLA